MMWMVYILTTTSTPTLKLEEKYQMRTSIEKTSADLTTSATGEGTTSTNLLRNSTDQYTKLNLG